ncbi:hypothetical protein [Coleofasciculus chthonoplastes]|uniref:hypothetical protein n=1 Tax=Coleofasciculus chthonoplastes TaxID=64178 RepID=UPI0032FEC2C6
MSIDFGYVPLVIHDLARFHHAISTSDRIPSPQPNHRAIAFGTSQAYRIPSPHLLFPSSRLN